MSGGVRPTVLSLSVRAPGSTVPFEKLNKGETLSAGATREAGSPLPARPGAVRSGIGRIGPVPARWPEALGRDATLTVPASLAVPDRRVICPFAAPATDAFPNMAMIRAEIDAPINARLIPHLLPRARDRPDMLLPRIHARGPGRCRNRWNAYV